MNDTTISISEMDEQYIIPYDNSFEYASIIDKLEQYQLKEHIHPLQRVQLKNKKMMKYGILFKLNYQNQHVLPILEEHNVCFVKCNKQMKQHMKIMSTFQL